MQIAPYAGPQRQGKVIQHRWVQANGAGRAKPAILRRERVVGKQGTRLTKKDDRAINADNLTQDQKELPEQPRTIQSMTQNGRESTKRLKAAEGIIASTRTASFRRIRFQKYRSRLAFVHRE